jgi:hypothetical protein
MRLKCVNETCMRLKNERRKPVLTDGNDVFIAARVSAPADNSEQLSLTCSNTEQGHVTGVDHTSHGSTAAEHRVAPQNVFNAQRLLFRHRGTAPPPNTPSLAVDTRRARINISVPTAAAAAVEYTRKFVNFEAGWFCLNGKIFVRTAPRCQLLIVRQTLS